MSVVEGGVLVGTAGAGGIGVAVDGGTGAVLFSLLSSFGGVGADSCFWLSSSF